MDMWPWSTLDGFHPDLIIFSPAVESLIRKWENARNTTVCWIRKRRRSEVHYGVFCQQQTVTSVSPCVRSATRKKKKRKKKTSTVRSVSITLCLMINRITVRSVGYSSLCVGSARMCITGLDQLKTQSEVLSVWVWITRAVGFVSLLDQQKYSPKCTTLY